MGVNAGPVRVTFLDDRVINYDRVSNVSISSDWMFLKLADGGRVQIPSATIREVYEDADVYVKGTKDGKRSS